MATAREELKKEIRKEMKIEIKKEIKKEMRKSRNQGRIKKRSHVNQDKGICIASAHQGLGAESAKSRTISGTPAMGPETENMGPEMDSRSRNLFEDEDDFPNMNHYLQAKMQEMKKRVRKMEEKVPRLNLWDFEIQGTCARPIKGDEEEDEDDNITALFKIEIEVSALLCLNTLVKEQNDRCVEDLRERIVDLSRALATN